MKRERKRKKKKKDVKKEKRSRFVMETNISSNNKKSWAWKGWDKNCAIKREVLLCNHLGESAAIIVQRGNIPLIITVPNDGMGIIPKAAERGSSQGRTKREVKVALVADDLRYSIEKFLNPRHFHPRERLYVPKGESVTPENHDSIENTEKEESVKRLKEQIKELRSQLVRLLKEKYDSNESSMEQQGTEILTNIIQSGRLEKEEEDKLMNMLKEMNDNDIYLRPYLVVSNISRKYCDLNQPIEEAFVDPLVAPYYRSYHEIIRRYIIEVNELVEGTNFPAILLDVNGKAFKNNIYRRTGNCLTVKKLIAERGLESLTGFNSILGYLQRKYNYNVYPSCIATHSEEKKKMNAGFTVMKYGSQNKGQDHIDAIQLDLGMQLRNSLIPRELFSLHLAESILNHIYYYGQKEKECQ
jgi:hypothetical protein